MSLNKSNQSRQFLSSTKEDAPSLNEKFSIYSLESSFLPAFFALESDKNPQHPDNTRRDASSIESQIIPSMIKVNRDPDQDSFTMEHRNEILDPTNSTQVTQIYVTSEEEMDSPESKSVDQLIYISDEKNDVGELKRAKNVKSEIGISSSAKNRHRNRVDVVEFRKASEEDLRSAKGVRRLRKKVSVTSRGGGKTQSNRGALALAIVEGNLAKVEEIVDAYIALYQSDGFKLVISFRFDIHPRTLVIEESTAATKKTATLANRSESNEDLMFSGLSPLHVACVFDQEHVLSYFLRFRLSSCLDLASSSSGQTLLHTCAWFGTLAPMNLLLEHGCDPSKPNNREQSPLHLAALQGHRACVAALLKAGADPMLGDQSDNTPLHMAVIGSHYDCVRELLNDDEVDVNHANNEGGTPLHYASSAGTVGLLLANGADPTLRMRDPPISSFDSFLERMPEGCNIILNSYLKSNGKSAGAADFEITMNYALFLRAHKQCPGSGEIAPLAAVVEADQRDILKHPVCESYLHFKWLLVKKFFHAYILFYTLFLTSITFLILLDLSPIFEGLEVGVGSKILLAISIASISILLAKNTFILFYNPKHYFRTMQNAFEMSTLAFAILYILVRRNTFVDVTDEVYFTAGAHAGALTLFASWVNFTLLLGKLPAGGIYINMIVGTSKDVLRFLLLYSTSIIAFALCFHVLSSDHEHFADPLTSFMCTLAMMVGEFNFGELFVKSEVTNNGTTQIMFVLFLVLVSIIIMNLLIGLAISNITAQFQSAGVNRLRMTVRLVHMMDDVFATICRCIPIFYRTTQILDYLMKSTSAYTPSAEDLTVYIYPNKHKDYVCVLDQESGMIKKTGLRMPPWILVNVHKILQAEQESLWQRLEVEVTKKRQEERLVKLVADMRLMRREMLGLKHDLRLISNGLRKLNSPGHMPPINSA